MGRINSNIPALTAQRQLARSHGALGTALERLSTGLRINRGSDDPNGLIVAERLRAEIAGTNQAIVNSQRAGNVLATTEGALNEVSSLLNDIQGLVVGGANSGALSDAEIRANQLQIDSAIEAIARIANTTAFAGQKLLDGSLGYVTSGVNTATIEGLDVRAASFGQQRYVPVSVDVTQSAMHGELRFATSQIGQAITIEVSGDDGVASLTFSGGTTASAILTAINAVADSTGIAAELINTSNPASGIVMRSRDYGSDAFVSVQLQPSSAGTFDTTDLSGNPQSRDAGRDVAGTINGTAAVGHGRTLELNTTALNVALTVSEAANEPGATSFAITGGGAIWQLGPGVGANQQVNLGIPSISPAQLGNATVGFLSDVATGQPHSLVGGHASDASAIVAEAIRQIAVLRGRLGAFEKDTLDTNVNQLSGTLENLSSSESAIRDTDFAAETSELTRQQILVNAGTSILAMANQTPQIVLQLLGTAVK